MDTVHYRGNKVSAYRSIEMFSTGWMSNRTRHYRGGGGGGEGRAGKLSWSELSRAERSRAEPS